MQINIEKKHVYIISVLLILVIGTFVYAGVANYLTGAATSGANSADAFGHDMVCVSAKKTEGQTSAEIIGSTDGGDYSVSQVISSASNAEIECNSANGWFMTGCSTSGIETDDNDGSMSTTGNGCNGETDGTGTVWIRCCMVG